MKKPHASTPRIQPATLDDVTLSRVIGGSDATTQSQTTATVELVYQKIEGTWKLGNKVWQDDWLAPT